MLHQADKCPICVAAKWGSFNFADFDRWGYMPRREAMEGRVDFLTVAIEQGRTPDKVIRLPTHNLEIHRLRAEEIAHILLHTLEWYGRDIAACYLELLRRPNVVLVRWHNGHMNVLWWDDRQVEEEQTRAPDEWASYKNTQSGGGGTTWA